MYPAKEGSRAIAIHPTISPNRANNTNAHAHSCPAPRHMETIPSNAHRVPRTPLIGSLPDPTSSFLNEPMPLLCLPPPQRISENTTPPPRETIVQFASSCPAQMTFLNRRFTDDSTDLLSQSPSIALMRSIDTTRRERLSSMDNRHSFDRPSFDTRLSLERLSLNEQDEDKFDTSEEDDVFVFEAQ